jgi:c(7)-type cytochrome triheme protein
MKLFIIGFLIILLAVPLSFAKVGGGDITLKIKHAGDVVFSHDSHVSNAGLKCTDCHASLYMTKEKHRTVTMAQMQTGQSCGACHNGKKVFSVKEDCNTCHQK